jgi:hypothetical protein
MNQKKSYLKEGFTYYLGKDGYLWQDPFKWNKTGKKERVIVLSNYRGSKTTKVGNTLFLLDENGFFKENKQIDEMSFPPDIQLEKRKRSKKGELYQFEKCIKEMGYLYFIGKDGYIWAAPMKHNTTGRKKRVGFWCHRDVIIGRCREEREKEWEETHGNPNT